MSQSYLKPQSLEQRYFYLPMICRKPLLKQINNVDPSRIGQKTLLGEICAKDDIINQSKNQLHLLKKNIFHQLIVENRKIPSRWENKLNFPKYIDEAFKEEEVVKRFTMNIKHEIKKRKYAEDNERQRMKNRTEQLRIEQEERDYFYGIKSKKRIMLPLGKAIDVENVSKTRNNKSMLKSKSSNPIMIRLKTNNEDIINYDNSSTLMITQKDYHQLFDNKNNHKKSFNPYMIKSSSLPMMIRC